LNLLTLLTVKIFKFKKTASNCVIVPNFVAIRHTVGEIWRFLDFSKMAASAMLDLWCTCLDHPRRVLGGLCQRANFGDTCRLAVREYKRWLYPATLLIYNTCINMHMYAYAESSSKYFEFVRRQFATS